MGLLCNCLVGDDRGVGGGGCAAFLKSGRTPPKNTTVGAPTPVGALAFNLLSLRLSLPRRVLRFLCRFARFVQGVGPERMHRRRKHHSVSGGDPAAPPQGQPARPETHLPPIRPRPIREGVRAGKAWQHPSREMRDTSCTVRVNTWTFKSELLQTLRSPISHTRAAIRHTACLALCRGNNSPDRRRLLD